jgi:phosphatidate cytidylyltransferase
MTPTYASIPTAIIKMNNTMHKALIIIPAIANPFPFCALSFFICTRAIIPKISPNKTWSGFIGGITAAIISGLYLLKILGISLSSFIPNTLLIFMIACAAHAGDLIESSVKRYFGVKNAGELIPGHGGVLDRLDSLFLVVILIGLFLLFGIINI